MRGKPVNEIGAQDGLSVLQGYGSSPPETAERLRGRIKNVLDAAKPKGCRTGENPARLRRGTGRCHPWRWRCCCAG